MTLTRENINSTTFWASALTTTSFIYQITELDTPKVITVEQINELIGGEWKYDICPNGQLAYSYDQEHLGMLGVPEEMDVYIIKKGEISIERRISDMSSFAGQVVFGGDYIQVNLEVGMRDISEFKTKEIVFVNKDGGLAFHALGGNRKLVIETLLSTTDPRAKVLKSVLRDRYGFTK